MHRTYALLAISLMVTGCFRPDLRPDVRPTPPPTAPVADTTTPEPTASNPGEKPCITGLIILADDGRMELEGCPKEWEVFSPFKKGNTDTEDSDVSVGRSIYKIPNPSKSELFNGPDMQGIYYFPGEDANERYIEVDQEDQLWYHAKVDGEWTQKELFSALKVNRWVSEKRKLTPFLTPGIMGPPVVPREQACGQILCGDAWHMLHPLKQTRLLLHLPSKGKS